MNDVFQFDDYKEYVKKTLDQKGHGARLKHSRPQLFLISLAKKKIFSYYFSLKQNITRDGTTPPFMF
ncbi:MAG: hypothetical protein K2Q18_12460 [Bdellovibrionales bacterium]|nr:hypothetical protein [Bdellovibrionales bacterium]